MKKLFLVFFLSLVSLPGVAKADDLCGGWSPAPQCQTGPNGGFNGFFDPQMDPRFNPEVDPRFNPQADPRFNPQADPRFNPQADPRFNPGATPCDLGIGNNCKSNQDYDLVEEDYSYPQPVQPPTEDLISGSVPIENDVKNSSPSTGVDYRVILGMGVLVFAFRKEIKALFINRLGKI